MKDDFKKRLQTIVDERKEKESKKEEVKGKLENEVAKRKECKQKLHLLTNEKIIPFVQDLNDMFVESGDRFEVYNDERATNTDDQKRIFTQVLFYPKDRPQRLVGLSTASIKFECERLTSDIVISWNTELRPSKLDEVKRMSHSDFNEEVFEEYITDFVEKVTA